MKKTIFTLFALLPVAMQVHAQGFYIKAGLGYAIPQASQTLDVNGHPYSGSQTAPNLGAAPQYDISKVSFTSGLQGLVGVGYMFNKNIGVELGGNLCMADKTYTTTETSIPNPSGAYVSDAKFTNQAKFPVYIIPALVVQSSGTKFNLYMRAGLALPVSGDISVSQQYTYHDVLSTVEILKEDVKTNFALGFAGAAGVHYNLGGSISVWGEISGLMSSLYAKQAKVTEHSLDGTAAMTTPTQGSTIKFNVNGQSSATQLPTYSMPFSNVGFNLGITINLHKEKTEGDTTN